MAKNDLQNVWVLLADLFRELSWTLRIAFFAGLAAGLGVGIYLASQIGGEEIRRGVVKILVVLILGMTALGGFLGLALGTVVELAIQAVVRPSPKEPRKRSKRR